MKKYKLLIVDDEDPEREGMANFIPWGDHGIELVATAWNGADGYEKMKEYRPDIVLTDIKMPVMDGIGLIKKARREFPNVEFVVLSGYGEYEYTSQAMEEGVRHYILKPCDEEKILKAMAKVCASLEERQREKEQMAHYSNTIRDFLPRAKEQVFYNLLMGREQIQADDRLFMEELAVDSDVCILVIRMEQEIDYVVQFVLHNILEELLDKDAVLLATAFSNEMVFLLRAYDVKKTSAALRRMRMELERLAGRSLWAALSRAGGLADIRALYQQAEELFRMGAKSKEPLFTYELFRESREEMDALIDYARLDGAEDMERILTELYFISCKMRIRGFAKEKKSEVYRWLQKVFDRDKSRADFVKEDVPDMGEWELLRETAEFLAGQKPREEEPEQRRMDQILFAVFEHLPEPGLSIRYLAREVLYMNEDYFGRLFLRYKKEKFSAWLLNIRIGLAGRIMRYSPDTKVSEVAGMVGFPEDGQYFSKVFRKATGMTPSQYREAEKEG